MDLWMFNWNKTTTTCSPEEIWSDCFLRLAFEAPGYDCSTIGSIFCSAVQLGQTPSEAHAFYAAYNIYGIQVFSFSASSKCTLADRSILLAVWRYFSNWQTALFAFKSQQAIARLVSILNVPGAPKLTVNSLLAAIVGNYGLDPAVDEALIDILPSGPKAEPLNTNQQYMSTQLAGLLGDILMLLSTDFRNGYFLFLVRHGQMMTDTTESLQNLEANLAGTYQNTTSSIQPISS